MAIKSQHYFSKFCPTSKLHTSGIFLKTVLKNNILQPCNSYHCYLIYISEVSELNERHKRKKSKKNGRENGSSSCSSWHTLHIPKIVQ